MSISLSGSLPTGDGNGLAAIVSELLKDPRKRHVAVAILDSPKTTVNNDTGDTVPTVRIRRIEIIEGDDVEPLRRILERAFERRTGATTLPFDLEQDVRAAFDGIDPTQTTLDEASTETCPAPDCGLPEGHDGDHAPVDEPGPDDPASDADDAAPGPGSPGFSDNGDGDAAPDTTG